MNGRRLINSERNTERFELKANRTDLNLLVDGLKRAVIIGGLKYEDTFKYVSMVEDLISIRDGEIIDEI